MTPAFESQSWLRETGLDVRARKNWWVDIEVGGQQNPRVLCIALSPNHWTLRLQQGDRVSFVSFTPAGYTVERDDLALANELASFAIPKPLLRFISERLAVELAACTVVIRSNVSDAARVLRAWLHAV